MTLYTAILPIRCSHQLFCGTYALLLREESNLAEPVPNHWFQLGKYFPQVSCGCNVKSSNMNRPTELEATLCAPCPFNFDHYTSVSHVHKNPTHFLINYIIIVENHRAAKTHIIIILQSGRWLVIQFVSTNGSLNWSYRATGGAFSSIGSISSSPLLLLLSYTECCSTRDLIGVFFLRTHCLSSSQTFRFLQHRVCISIVLILYATIPQKSRNMEPTQTSTALLLL